VLEWYRTMGTSALPDIYTDALGPHIQVYKAKHPKRITRNFKLGQGSIDFIK